MHQIKHRITGAVLFESDATSLKAAVECAVGRRVSLAHADLARSDLSRAHLAGADLRHAALNLVNFGDADLAGADLRHSTLLHADLRRVKGARADFYGANLTHACLWGARLEGADLRHANLEFADLRHCCLGGARFEDCEAVGARFDSSILDEIGFTFNEHTIVGEVLLRHAGTSRSRREAAGLISMSRDWCWGNFFRLRRRKAFAWAIETLALYLRDDYPQPDQFGQALEWVREERRQAQQPRLPLVMPAAEARPA